MNDVDLWHIAHTVCTPRELEALQLKAKGFGHRRIARLLGITPAAVRDRLDSAHRKINQQKQTA